MTDRDDEVISVDSYQQYKDRLAPELALKYSIVTNRPHGKKVLLKSLTIL